MTSRPSKTNQEDGGRGTIEVKQAIKTVPMIKNDVIHEETHAITTQEKERARVGPLIHVEPAIEETVETTRVSQILATPLHKGVLPTRVVHPQTSSQNDRVKRYPTLALPYSAAASNTLP